MPIINVDDLMELSDLFTVVEEPEYSKGKLLSYQEKYGMPSDVFYNYYTQMLGLAKVLNSEELDDWAYNYEIFLEAGGDIWELIFYEENGFPSGLCQPGPWKGCTIKALKENGYDSLKEYLQDLAEEHNIPYPTIVSLYQLLGESELFDGLVSAVQDAEWMDW